MNYFYLIGESIDRSLSRYIHQWIYKSFNIGAEYKNKNIDIANFDIEIESILLAIQSKTIHGINVTNPYKLKVICQDIFLSKHAKRINAINCVYNDSGLIGDNTDWIGFIKSIEYNEINLKEYNVKVIGAGGASRAIIYSLQKLGVNNFTIHNRTKKEFFVNKVKYVTQSLDELNTNEENKFLINCVHPNIINDIVNKVNANSIHYFYDLNYNKSDLHDMLESKDIKVLIGLDMLIYQAIKSIEIWLQRELCDKIDIEEIKNYLKKKSLC